MTSPDKRPPFVESQGLRLLAETNRPEQYLQAEHFRAGRTGGAALQQEDVGFWLDVPRLAVAHNRLTNKDGSNCDLSRLTITTDAGVGKTTAMRWMHAELNRPGSQTAAFHLAVHQLPREPAELILGALLPDMRRATGNQADALSERDGIHLLERLRERGQIVLLVDALDQAPPDGSAVSALRFLLEDVQWRACRLVISARPHALQRHWSELFAPQLGFGWRFVQLDEFDERQQREFLGSDEQGRDRFELIATEARDILSTPRVLEYLRDLPSAALDQVKTAADVYWHSINYLLKEAMNNSRAARRIGLAAEERLPAVVQARSISAARKLLGAIAVQMTSTLVQPARAAGNTGQRVPNFDGVPPNGFESFKEQLASRLTGQRGVDRPSLERDIDALAALNSFVGHGIFDTDVEGLDRILWRNRTLQEFFTAYWLSQYCTTDDADLLWDWIYLKEVPTTEEYYWVWRFVSEMHQDARDPQAWLRTIEPLYRPGDGTAEGTKRSSEMAYRAWEPLTALADVGEPAAVELLTRFHGEFENLVLAGRRGTAVQQAAQQFCDSFIDIPAGTFRMGSPQEKQGMSNDLRQYWEEYLDHEGDPKELAKRHIAQSTFMPSRQGEANRRSWLEWWTCVFRDRNLDAVINRYYPKNETPEEPIQSIDAFRMTRWPIINFWYRLFDPGHGMSDSFYREKYAAISADDNTPTIYVSWYDAWMFCQWARWQGRSCRLPHENEWEYAAKAGTPWDRNYWWGDEMNVDCCVGEHIGSAMVAPDPNHANPWQLVDMLGNVWEWCQDEYRTAYARTQPPDSSSRVLRGGWWTLNGLAVRSAFRITRSPSDAGSNRGFRVARQL